MSMQSTKFLILDHPRYSQLSNPLSLFSIVMRTSLCCQLQRSRCILLWNVQLDELKNVSRAELLIFEQLVGLFFCSDLVSPRFTMLCAKCVDKVLTMPRLDVVICCVHAVNESFNGVPLITDDKTIEYQCSHPSDIVESFTYIIGLSPNRIIVESSWTVSWNEPSPTKRMVLLSEPASRAARHAP